MPAGSCKVQSSKYFEKFLWSNFCHKRRKKSIRVCSLWLRIHVIEFEHLKRTSIYLNSSQILKLIFFISLPHLFVRSFYLCSQQIHNTDGRSFFSFPIHNFNISLVKCIHLICETHTANAFLPFIFIYLLYFRYAFDFYYSVGFVWDFPLLFAVAQHSSNGRREHCVFPSVGSVFIWKVLFGECESVIREKVCWTF